MGIPLHILIVRPDDELRQAVISALDEEQLVTEASGAHSALRTLHDARFGVVILDADLPQIANPGFVRRVRERAPESVVAVVTRNSDAPTEDVWREVGVSILRKPVSSSDISSLMGGVSTPIESGSTLAAGSVVLDVPCHPAAVRTCSDVIVRLVECFSTTIRRPHFQQAVNELLFNALEHGLLGIDSDEKQALCQDELLEQEIAERSRTASAQGKQLRIELTLDHKLFRATVSDGGPGFDWRSKVATMNLDRTVELPSGRGLFLIHRFFDTVEYNASGNAVTVTKDL